MKLDKKLIIFGLVTSAMILTGALITGCITTSPARSDYLPGFVVHEWGIFEQRYGSDFASVITGPMVSQAIAKKPVIYFHYNENLTDVVVEVDINGDVLVTIPNATMNPDGIGWTVDIINNTVVSPDGTEYEYLFYECQINLGQGVIAFVTDDGENVTFYVKNIEDYDIKDIFYIYGYPETGGMLWRPGLTYIHIDSLESGESTTITVPKKNNTSYDTSEILDALMNSGLTQKESQDLIDYWEDIWFLPTNFSPYAQMFYTIPEEVYDELLPLTISPTPEIIERVGLFFITDIPINEPVLDEFTEFGNCSSCWGSEYINSTWLDDQTLEVTAGVLINCCNYIAKGNVFFIDGNLQLRYDVIQPDPFICNCVCFHEMKFVISGIAQKEYNITLEPNLIVDNFKLSN